MEYNKKEVSAYKTVAKLEKVIYNRNDMAKSNR